MGSTTFTKDFVFEDEIAHFEFTDSPEEEEQQFEVTGTHGGMPFEFVMKFDAETGCYKIDHVLKDAPNLAYQLEDKLSDAIVDREL